MLAVTGFACNLCIRTYWRRISHLRSAALPTDSSSTPPDNDAGSKVDRRDFLRLTTAGAGLLALGACSTSDGEPVPGILPHPKINLFSGANKDVVVVGAGLWGSFTAYN